MPLKGVLVTFSLWDTITMNASKAASAANQNQRINPYHFHAVKHFIINNEVERFSGDMKLVFSHIVNLQNKFGKVYLSYARIDEMLGLGTDLFNTSQFIIQKFMQMGIVSKHEDGSRSFFIVSTPALEVA